VSAVARWAHVDLDAALEILRRWAGRPVHVSVDVVASETGGPGFVGASFDPRAEVLVLEFAGEDRDVASAVLVDIQPVG
jgi:hypothetical protein